VAAIVRDVKAVGVPRGRALPWAVVLVAAFVELGPLLVRRGFALTYDMVFVPRLPWSASLLGLDGQPTRSVPSDALVSVASVVVPGDIVQKLVLFATLVAAGTGAARLAGGPVLRQTVVAFTYMWNPFVYERLVIGHWTLLVGYAALPWAVAGAAPADPGRRSRRTGLDWRRLGPALVAAAAGGAYATVIVLPTVLLVTLLRGGCWSQRLRAAGMVGACGAALALPWWLPATLGTVPLSVDPRSVDAFAPRADTLLGSVGSLFGLGGAWNAQVAPPGRNSVVVAVLTLAFLGIASSGLLSSWSLLPPWRSGLAVAAAAGLVVAAAGASPAGRSLLKSLIDAVPAAAVLRDSQKLVAPWSLLAAIGFGCGVSWLQTRLSAHPAPGARAVPFLTAMLPLAVVPALVWGAGGRLAPVSYPATWATASDAARAHRGDGAALVLPWSAYRRYAWNDGRTVLDPAPRYFGGPAYASADLPVGGLVVRADGGPAAGIAAAADADRVDVAREIGTTVVLTESVDGLEVLVTAVAPTGPLPATVPVWPVVCGDVLAALVAATLVGASAWGRRFRLLP
jgi:hypothetical protein